MRSTRSSLGLISAFALLGALALVIVDAGPARADTPPPAPDPTVGIVTAKACSALDDKCQRGTFSVSKTDKIGLDFDYDTDWLPKDAAVQVRLVAALHGRTRVDLGGALDATWPDPLTLRPVAKRDAGLLAIDDGAVLKVKGRFKVSVAGKDFSWEGDLPGLPKVDLQAVGWVTFEPWAWKGGADLPAPPRIDRKTGEITLAKVPLTDAIIPIPGISGGFELQGEGEFSASYVTTRIAFDELVAKGSIADVTPTSSFTRAFITSTPSIDTTLFLHGELTHGTTLHFIPALYFSILGKKFNLDLVDIPVALPDTVANWDFDPVAFHVPLPRLEVKPREINLGEIPLATSTSITLALFDTGEAKVVLEADDKSGVAAVVDKHLSIDPGSSDAVHATITPAAEGPIETTIVLASNDPLQPSIPVKIKGVVRAGAPPAGDPETGATGGCGCVAAGDTSLPDGWLLGLVAIGLLRGRRRRN
jgi:MYXO-CTERM domain-containing protein